MRNYIYIIILCISYSCRETNSRIVLNKLCLDTISNFEWVILDTNFQNNFSDYKALFLENTEKFIVNDVKNLTCYKNDIFILLKSEIRLYDLNTGYHIQTYTTSDKVDNFVSFDYDTLSNKLFALDTKKSCVVCFNSSGKTEQVLQLDSNYEYDNLINLGNHSLLITVKSLPVPVTLVANLETEEIKYIDKPTRKSFTPDKEKCDSILSLVSPLYVFNYTTDGLLLKYLFNDTIYYYNSQGKSPAYLVQMGRDKVSYKNKRKLVKNNERLSLLSFWQEKNRWLIRFSNEKNSRIVWADKFMRPCEQATTVLFKPNQVFKIKGSNSLFIDKTNRVIFSVQDYKPIKGEPISEYMIKEKLPLYLLNYDPKSNLLICYYIIK